ncbi:reverse transcriptase domain-containing protein [Tanacetum coccineum]
MNFVIVRSSSPCNGIIGRPGARKLQAVPSTTHGMLKFPVAGGILTLKTSKIIPIKCTTVSRPERQPLTALQAIEKRIKVAINPDYPEQTIMIGSTLTEEGRNKLCDLLQRKKGEVKQRAGTRPYKKKLRNSWMPGVQKLNEKLASLNRFLAKSGEKSLPFFKTLKKCTKKSDIHWTEEAESAFKQMKQLIAELPTLTAPEEKEELIVYLAATKEAPCFKRSGSELHINGKIGLGIGTCQQASEKILLGTPNYTDHGPTHKAIERLEEDSLDAPMEVEEELTEPWILFTDGLSYTDGSEAGLILTNPEGAEFTYALRFRFETTNNEAEYKALIAGLRIAEEMGVKNLQENVDSRLVANQVNGTYIAKEADMIWYLKKVRILTNGFGITQREAINELEVLIVVEEEGDTWMTPIYKYLRVETLSVEVNKARAVRKKSQRFSVINGVLYKKSFLRPWLRCVRPLQANYVLREIHEGSCSMHAGTRSVVAKALRIGYY